MYTILSISSLSQNCISYHKALFCTICLIILLYTETENITSDNITSSSIPSSSNTAFNKKRKLNECETKDKQLKDEKLKSNTVKVETSKYDISTIIYKIFSIYLLIFTLLSHKIIFKSRR